MGGHGAAGRRQAHLAQSLRESPMTNLNSAHAAALWGDDPSASNTATDPSRVELKPLPVEVRDGSVVVELPPASWAALSFEHG